MFAAGWSGAEAAVFIGEHLKTVVITRAEHVPEVAAGRTASPLDSRVAGPSMSAWRRLEAWTAWGRHLPARRVPTGTTFGVLVLRAAYLFLSGSFTALMTSNSTL